MTQEELFQQLNGLIQQQREQIEASESAAKKEHPQYQQRLLDEFAMTALTGWLATFRGNDSPSAELGAFCYEIAEIMMAERAKRISDSRSDAQ